ncbi:RhtB Putative threonine efflux protein [Rhabdaerophilaceae bacterium]
MAYLIGLTLSEGRKAGLAAVAGVALGLAIIGGLAVIGLASILAASPVLQGVLRYAGVAFLLFLAWEAWLGAANEETQGLGGVAAFRRALVTNLLNPKAAAFYLTVMPLFFSQTVERETGAPLLLVAIYVGIATLVHAALVLFADQLRPFFVKGSRERIVRRGFAIALALVACWFFWETR